MQHALYVGSIASHAGTAENNDLRPVFLRRRSGNGEYGLYYFTLEDIVGDGSFDKTIHFWAADPDDVRYWMGKNEIELADFVDERVEKDKALYEAIMNDLCPDDD